ncbi:serine hydrolase domain-containing protein [Bradyrhizobium sp. 1(2017)]|uniref:serine hydrolase domain-containing protein n=1 Tax=Bradyrhizobium sp. 1(2017) TaxID=1404888 RepID=UPI00140EEFD8|nr:serine hydrolase [Bradyrhizobium sp. 1(2017)]QIO32498.1 serine hydrolase [Bradyrhizobium sp. 1(2017)]
MAGVMTQHAAAGEADAGPLYLPSGPSADLHGEAAGYPIADPSLSVQPGNPFEPKYRVGAFTHLDEIFKTRTVKRAAAPWSFRRAPTDVNYWHFGDRSSVRAYLARNPVTGLIIAKDDCILFEGYQYGRTDKNRFVSQSMAKSITGLLIGIAVSEGKIRSVDDTAETYVPGFAGTEYGKTRLRDLLHMSSGVEFGEEEDNSRDLNRLWRTMVQGYSLFTRGTIKSIIQFNKRIAPAGTRFFYASIEPDVLGVVLRYATGKTASAYLEEKVWSQIGSESDASWMVDKEGYEIAHGFFSANLRDYARLGRLLAHDGSWNGNQVVNKQWLIDATTVRPSDGYLSPGKAGPNLGYGYLLWLLPGTRRQFALIGSYGQIICVDPSSKLVMVQTSVERSNEVWPFWATLMQQFAHG